MKVAVHILVVYFFTFSIAENTQNLLSKLSILKDNGELGQLHHDSSSIEENINGLRDKYVVENCDIPPDSSHANPWHVGIFSEGFYYCEGTLISNEWVLTTAHCIYGSSSVEVVLGVNSFNDSSQVTILTSEILIHEGYSSSTLENDICLLKLSTPVSSTNQIQPICLPSNSDPDLAAGETVLATSYQHLCEDGGIGTIQAVPLTVISNDNCQTSDAFLCVVYNGSDSNGNNGGPLYYASGEKMYIRGTPSFGSSSACESGTASAGLRTKYYLDWIENNTGIVRGS